MVHKQFQSESMAPQRRSCPAMRDAVQSRGNRLDPGTADLQKSIGNQGVLRLLRRSAAAHNPGISVVGGPQAPQQMDARSAQTQPISNTPQTQPTQQVPGPGQTAQPMPYTAIFSLAQHGARAHQVCRLPDTPNCVVSWSKWRLIDATGAAVMPPTIVNEKFIKISGPDDVFNKLKEQSNTTEKGFFDDCYGLCVPDGYPAFTLEVRQNHIVNGQIASQNLLTYSPSGVMIRVCQRGPNGFGPPCRRF
jgi:hypothetical protein